MVCLWDYVLFYISFLISISNKCLKVPVNHAPPHVGERGNFLWLAQKHTKNTSYILSIAFVRPLYALELSTSGVTGADTAAKEISLEYLKDKLE